MTPHRLAVPVLTLLLAGCGLLATPVVTFDYAQQAPYPTTPGSDATYSGILKSYTPVVGPPSASLALQRPASAGQATPNTSFQLVTADHSYDLSGRYPELVPYDGRAATITGKLVNYTLLNGTPFQDFVPRTITLP